MKTEDVHCLVMSYTLVVAFAAFARVLRQREVAWLFSATVALLAVNATAIVGFFLEPGTSYPSLLVRLVKNRDFSTAVATAMGAAAALTWLIPLTQTSATARSRPLSCPSSVWCGQFLLALSIVGVVGGGQAFIWNRLRGADRDPPVRVLVPEFEIEKIADIAYKPIRIAADELGNVYVNYDYFEAWGDMGGAIVRIAQDPSTGEYQQRVVADSTLLMRSYGLAARAGDLFVSRSGIYPRAAQGTVSYESTGAVTRLQDLDHDGYFEYADDVVTGLPGARGPDTMQQNNGIAFAADGSLFLTSSGAANRALDEHPWGGVVLRVSPDFSETRVFASGFRNPFGIAFGPDGELFATDNDIDENPGDELNHVRAGAHYGHPFVVPDERSVEPVGFQPPILVSERESNYLGIAYATSPKLPEPYRNCLYVVDHMQHSILRIELRREGETYRVQGVYPFASLTNPVDIAVTSAGEFFVITRHTQNVYRIRLKGSP